MSKIVEFLNNDMNILNVHTRREARPGLWILAFPGEYLPSTHDFEWQYRGELSQPVLLQFCNEVRKEYERQTSQEIEALEPPTSRHASGEPGDQDSGEPRGGAVSAPETVPDVKASLATVLSTEVDELRNRAGAISSRIESLIDERDNLRKQLAAAERALAAYEEGE